MFPTTLLDWTNKMGMSGEGEERAKQRAKLKDYMQTLREAGP